MADLDELPGRTQPPLPERKPAGPRPVESGPHYDGYLGMRPGQLRYASEDIAVHLAAWRTAHEELMMARGALAYMETVGEPPYLAVGPRIWKLHEESIDLMWDHLSEGYRVAGAIRDTLVAVDKGFRNALDAEYASGKALLDGVERRGGAR
jgi:hypothetical protein